MTARSDNGFWIPGSGSDGMSAFFEDDGRTGYLYVYDSNADKIVHALHIYNRTEVLSVKEDDVFVTWSSDLRKCGVVIFGEMRGVIDLRTNRATAIPLVDEFTEGISDPESLEGFEREGDVDGV